jgi:hypothetical protein
LEQDTLDLPEQPMQEPEVAASDPNDSGHRLGVGKVRIVEIKADRVPNAWQASW